MKDRFHGSACAEHGLASAARRDSTDTVVFPYRGCTPASPRRGTARTAPAWIQRVTGHGVKPPPPILLDIGAPPAAIPCWSGRAKRWVAHTVPTAYRQRYDADVRPQMPGNPVSLKAVVAVAEARARFADHRTGRDCRPTNERLATVTGLSVRTVQRASTALRLLGVATEVVRGRQRTRSERLASWRVGDRGRGWASVWALHDSRIRSLSPHPEGSLLIPSLQLKKLITTRNRRKNTAGSSAATRRPSLDQNALALANRWVHDPHSPPWARRYRTGTPWARVLTKPAKHGWTSRDVNQLLTDWVGTGHWIPENPHKPIGLLGAILAAHGNLEDRPAALDIAREQEELAQARERLARQHDDRKASALARQVGREALSSAGHAAARLALNEIAARRRKPRGDNPS